MATKIKQNKPKLHIFQFCTMETMFARTVRLSMSANSDSLCYPIFFV